MCKSLALGMASLLIAVCLGCRSTHKLADGFYVEDKNARSSLRLVVMDLKGESHEFAVQECTNLMIDSIRTYSLKPYEEASQVEINGFSTDVNWSEKFPILVIQGKPYLELLKSSPVEGNQSPIKIPVMIKLKVDNESEAELIKTRLRKKFRIKAQE
jgi:hypothetical protein